VDEDQAGAVHERSSKPALANVHRRVAGVVLEVVDGERVSPWAGSAGDEQARVVQEAVLHVDDLWREVSNRAPRA
jgi:hypothetical protein